MDQSENVKRSSHHSALAEQPFPQIASEHFAELERHFSAIRETIDKNRTYSIRWSKSTRKLIKTALENTLDASVFNGTTINKEAFGNLALTNIGQKLADIVTPSSISEAEFVALHTSFQQLMLKIQTVQSDSLHSIVDLEDVEVEQPTRQTEDVEMSTQATHVSVGHETFCTLNDNILKTMRNKAAHIYHGRKHGCKEMMALLEERSR